MENFLVMDSLVVAPLIFLNIPSMPQRDYYHKQYIVLDFIDGVVGSYPNSPCISSLSFLHPAGLGLAERFFKADAIRL